MNTYHYFNERKEMMANLEERKIEAISRLKSLNLHPSVLKTFEDEDRIFYSEGTQLGGILYWLDNNPEWVEKVKEIEEEYNITCYHVIHNKTSFGELLSLLYVSEHEDEWDFDRADLEPGDLMRPIAYVLNLDIPEYSEFGSIGIREMAGGLIRTA